MITYKEFIAALKQQLQNWKVSKYEQKIFIDDLSRDFNIKSDNVNEVVYDHLIEWGVSKDDAGSFCAQLVLSLNKIDGIQRIHNKKAQIKKICNQMPKNPVHFYYHVNDEPMRRCDFAQIKKFVKVMRCKKYEFLVVDLDARDYFKNIKFIQTCRCNDGTYNVEVGVTEDEEIGNNVYRLANIDRKTVIKELKDVCIGLQRPVYDDWEDVSEEIFGIREKKKTAISHSVEIDDDTTINFYNEDNSEEN